MKVVDDDDDVVDDDDQIETYLLKIYKKNKTNLHFMLKT